MITSGCGKHSQLLRVMKQRCSKCERVDAWSLNTNLFHVEVEMLYFYNLEEF